MASPQPFLHSTSDTGASSRDGITSDNTPTLFGTGPASTTLKLFRDGNFLFNTTTSAGGTFSVTPSSLPDGTYSFATQDFVHGEPISAATLITRSRSSAKVSPWSAIASPTGIGRW